MIKKQESELFSAASRSYLNSQRVISEMCRVKKEKYAFEQKMLVEFDELLQIVLIYTSLGDENVSDIEISFIDRLTLEKDVIDEANKNNGTNYTWNDIKKFSQKQKNKMLLKEANTIYDILYKEIENFIMFLALVDAATEKDYKTILQRNLKDIVLNLREIDGSDTEDETQISDFVLNKFIFKRYNELYDIFKGVNFNLIYKE